MQDLEETPRSNRLHIGVFGRRNAGKSTMVNALCGHEVALVSEIPGTTTDPVMKSVELHGLGPCVLVDTAGFDDAGELGRLRVETTRRMLPRIHLAVLLFDGDLNPDDSLEPEQTWLAQLKKRKIPVLAVVNRKETQCDEEPLCRQIHRQCGLQAEVLCAKEKGVQERMRLLLLRLLPEGKEQRSIAGHLVKPGDVVLLVMPQDIQAPEGRLILPQVQTIRDLLDHHTIVVSATAKDLDRALHALQAPPDLIITDSQVFGEVYAKKPPQSRLTSFSVLMAGVKGDIAAYVEGAEAVDHLRADSRVLIAEACTHAPLAEDIGREKIPRLLRKRFGDSLQVQVVSGTDFPDDLSPYDLIVHCGACMFHRKYMLSRLETARAAGVPMTNYGVLLAKLNGILDKIVY